MSEQQEAARVARSLVALDVDGTIVDADDRLSERVRSAVRAVADDGHHVVVATGRALHGTLPVLDRLGLLTGFAVCSNGAVTVRLDPQLPSGYEIVDVVTFDPTPAVRLLREHLPMALFAIEELGTGFTVTGPFPDGELTGEVRVMGFDELLTGMRDAGATRVIVRSPRQTPADFLDVIQRVGLHGVSYAVGWSAWLDLNPEGVSKASALEVVRDRLGVDPKATLAVGDGRNDVEMFVWAAQSVAMSSAPAEVLAAAGSVCPPVEDDGLAQVLESYRAQR